MKDGSSYEVYIYIYIYIFFNNREPSKITRLSAKVQCITPMEVNTQVNFYLVKRMDKVSTTHLDKNIMKDVGK